ncbi:MAG: gliding motility-associated C-terminal domain-containing protein, partial [Hymenobacteraceae bacterium]|nr:gliding motility-associated C-terminal domain-containing protein [Hymenobacteraceae bacterium]
MNKFYLLLLILFAVKAQATHIVGGEFELENVNPAIYEYRLSLNLYFDDVNGDQGALDQTFKYSIFEKGTNRRMEDGVLPLSTISFVPYTNPDCAIGSLRTKRILYTKQLFLDPATFTNPGGYYIVSERCCRNNTIGNIIQPGATGQTFYLEFPPVETASGPFINSSPKLFPPLSDYACNNTLFYFDFSGDDPDGDSLIYEMVTPFKGHSQPSPGGNPAPVALPAPYPPVDWTAGLNTNNQIPGSPSITIDRFTGQLTLVPNRLGLFVFGIKCEEYRNGLKIGEVRRDFQLLVINCPTNEKPELQVKAPGAAGFYSSQDTIKIQAGAASRCINLYMSDTDLNENLSVRLRP